MGKGTEKLQKQLDAAHEALNELWGENVSLFAAVRFVLKYHNSCLCRHARGHLRAAYKEHGPDPDFGAKWKDYSFAYLAEAANASSNYTAVGISSPTNTEKEES